MFAAEVTEALGVGLVDVPGLQVPVLRQFPASGPCEGGVHTTRMTPAVQEVRGHGTSGDVHLGVMHRPSITHTPEEAACEVVGAQGLKEATGGH